MIYRVISIAIKVPPIIAIARGTLASDPGLVAKAIGNSPTMGVNAVITMGLKRSNAPSIIASLILLPL